MSLSIKVELPAHIVQAIQDATKAGNEVQALRFATGAAPKALVDAIKQLPYEVSLKPKPKRGTSLTNGTPHQAKKIKTEGGPMEGFVKRNDGFTSMHLVQGDMTVDGLKCDLENETGIPPDRQRLIFSGRQLEDNRTLDDCEVRDGSTLHIVLRLRGS